jgi:hypothetical protein
MPHPYPYPVETILTYCSALPIRQSQDAIRQATRLAGIYAAARPFPHITLDAALPAALAAQAAGDFPGATELARAAAAPRRAGEGWMAGRARGWMTRDTDVRTQCGKSFVSVPRQMGPATRRVFALLGSSEFLQV